MADDLAIRRCERVFRRNSLPLLISDHRIGRDVFGRAAPLLVFIIGIELLTAMQPDWRWWANLLTVFGALIVVSVAYTGVNLLRGRRWDKLPQAIDGPELAAFVLVPALIPLVLGGEWQRALALMVFNIVVLGLIWFTVIYGIWATLGWGLVRLVNDFTSSVIRLLRTLPFLLIVTLVLFYNSDVWQVFDRTSPAANFTLGALFAVLLLGFILSRLHGETHRTLAEATRDLDTPADVPEISRMQRINIAIMIGVSQFQQIIVVTVGIWLLFVGIGSLTITPEALAAWGVEGAGWTTTWTIGPLEVHLSQTLLRIATAIASFSGLYFTTSLVTDPTYRDEFIGAITAQLRRVMETRIEYFALLRSDDEPSPAQVVSPTE